MQPSSPLVLSAGLTLVFVMPNADLLIDVIEIVRGIAPATARIGSDTHLFTDLDLDSLRMLELADTLKTEFGVDLLMPPHSMAALTTPQTIAAAIEFALGSGD